MPNVCECGCGAAVVNRFKRGHWQKTPEGKCHSSLKTRGTSHISVTTVEKLCACGCLGIIIPSPKHKYREPKYLTGHRAKSQPNRYQPRLEEIPSGLCECGCGRETNIAQDTFSAQRHFRGYPLPFLPGHAIRPKGEQSHRWKGGRIYRRGYMMLYLPNDPRSDVKGYYPEHRYVWEQANGALGPGMHVHHINGITDDNRLENLIALTRIEHGKEHAGEGFKRHRENEPEAARVAARRGGKQGAAVRWKRTRRQCRDYGSHNAVAVKIS